MAAYPSVLWKIVCLILFCTAVGTDENSTSFNLNVTYNFTDIYTTEEPAEFDLTTTTTTSSSTEVPTEVPTVEPTEEVPTPPAEPLPVFGSLLVPVTAVDRLCPCDEHPNECDINCCCDTECGEEVALFTSCSVDTTSGVQQLCSHDVASYSLGETMEGYSELQSSVQKQTNSDIFCIQSQNRVDGFSYPSPTLPTDGNFDWLFKQFTSFIFGSEESKVQTSTAEPLASSGYTFGDLMGTAEDSGQRRTFMLPTPGVTANCVDNSPAAFLKAQSSRCSRRLVLDQDCSFLAGLSMDTYTNIQLFAGKNEDAVVVPVEVASVVLQSTAGTQSKLQMSDEGQLSPVLLNPNLCANVVLEVTFLIKYNPAGEITNASVSVVLGFVREAVLTLEQEFHITFVQDGEEMSEHISGNPGYVVGLPLVSGTKTMDGIGRSMDPRVTVSRLRSSMEQDCLRGLQQRSPVLFGVDSVSGCTLRLEDAANCSLVSQVLLDVLRGPNHPQYVASFGNSPLDYPLDWLPIKSNFNPGEAQGCSVPLSRHLEIEWTNYGSLVNPQAQIVSIREEIQTNSSSLALFSEGSRNLSISSSVSFIPVSAAALPGYRATPTIDAKLPFDFFFPFV